MLPNYAPWGGLEAYQMGVALTRKIWVKMGKINSFGGRVSTHYLMSAQVEKGDM